MTNIQSIQQEALREFEDKFNTTFQAMEATFPNIYKGRKEEVWSFILHHLSLAYEAGVEEAFREIMEYLKRQDAREDSYVTPAKHSIMRDLVAMLKLKMTGSLESAEYQNKAGDASSEAVAENNPNDPAKTKEEKK